jgi:hypothetical protein
MTAIFLCRRISMGTRGWTSRVASSDQQVLRMPCKVILATLAFSTRRCLVRAVQPGADSGQDVQVDAAGVQLVFQQDKQFEVVGERPGADLMEAPRTVPLLLDLAGITVTGPAPRR